MRKCDQESAHAHLAGLAWLAVVALACGRDPPTDLLELEVREAGLRNPEVTGGDVAIGGLRVRADLDVTDVAGGQHLFPVVLSGACLGTTGLLISELGDDDGDELLGVGLDLPAHGPADAVLDGGVGDLGVEGDAEPPLRIRHLFGEYTALGFGMHAMVGAAVSYFSNDADVAIWLGGLTPGIGVTWGMGAGLRLAVDE